MRVLLIVGLVVFVAAFLGAWIAIMLMARRASRARSMQDREAWRGDSSFRDDTTPRGPGAAAWMPVGVAGALGAAAASDANAEKVKRRSDQGGDGSAFIDPGVASHADGSNTPDPSEGDGNGGGWGSGDAGCDGGGDGGGD